MGVGSIPDSPPTPAMPAGETAEDRERSYMQMDQEKNRHSRPEQSAAQPQQQPQTQYNSSVFPSYNTVPAPAAAFNTPGLYPQPIAGMPIRGPRAYPQPGQVIVGYQVCEPTTGCCQCEDLSATGWIAVILLLLLFWPLFWIPFVMPECYTRYQIPVYGSVGAVQQHAGTVGAGYPIAHPI